jgi:hypothetical protein
MSRLREIVKEKQRRHEDDSVIPKIPGEKGLLLNKMVKKEIPLHVDWRHEKGKMKKVRV